MNGTIIKASGQIEDFNRKKILHSLINSGLSVSEAEDVIEKVAATIKPPLSTRKVFRAARRYVRSHNEISSMRYTLKQAVFALGPTGYPFEKYVARILRGRGFDTQVGTIVKGHCIEHEVDVVARRGNEFFMAECKFHHNTKTQSNVKTALYVHARFNDIYKGMRERGEIREGEHFRGMLVTNTKFSIHAIQFSECVGLWAVGWRYPTEHSLEQIISEGRTYPVTVLQAVNRKNVSALIDNDIILVSEVAAMDEDRLQQLTGFDLKLVRKLKQQAEHLQ